MNATGESGHSSILFNDTAVEKLNFVMTKFLELRKSEARKMIERNLPYGNVTVINLTELRGGIKQNIVPPAVSFFADMRIAADADWNYLENKVQFIRFFLKNQFCLFVCSFIELRSRAGNKRLVEI